MQCSLVVNALINAVWTTNGLNCKVLPKIQYRVLLVTLYFKMSL